MGINRKLERWKGAELLSQQQVEEIVSFERERGGRRLFNGLLWVGSFTIIIGVLSIIAANWQAIPPNVKVIVHLLINAGLAAGVYISDRRGRHLTREFCLVGLWGLTLTLIGLVGQVFHLNGGMASALFLWSVLVTPVIAVYGKMRVSLLPWLVSFLAGIGAALYEFVFPNFDSDQITTTIIGVYSFLPMMFILFARFSDKLERPLLQKILTFTGVTVIVFGASLACQIWYADEAFNDTRYHFLTLVILGLAMIGANFVQVQGNIKLHDLRQNVKMLLVGSFAIGIFSVMFMGVESQIMAAGTFILYWLYLGLIFNRMNLHGLVSLALVMTAGRIYIVYLEVFGSLLQTGVGLIISGLLLMGMTLGVRKLSKSIRTTKIAGGSHD